MPGVGHCNKFSILYLMTMGLQVAAVFQQVTFALLNLHLIATLAACMGSMGLASIGVNFLFFYLLKLHNTSAEGL